MYRYLKHLAYCRLRGKSYSYANYLFRWRVVVAILTPIERMLSKLASFFARLMYDGVETNHFRCTLRAEDAHRWAKFFMHTANFFVHQRKRIGRVLHIAAIRLGA